MVSPGCRRGHSLAELIVAVTFLGASLGTVGATAAAAAGRSRGAVLRQEAVREAATILDSLMTASQVEDGELDVAGARLRWAVLDAAPTPRVEVTATGPGGRELVRLETRWYPAEEPLPWEDVASPL